VRLQELGALVPDDVLAGRVSRLEGGLSELGVDFALLEVAVSEEGDGDGDQP
jgi:hypothetical protein